MEQLIFDPATTYNTIILDSPKLFHSYDNPVGSALFLRKDGCMASLPPIGLFYFTKTATPKHDPHTFPKSSRPALNSAVSPFSFSQN